MSVIYGPLDTTARNNAFSHLKALEDIGELHSLVVRNQPNHSCPAPVTKLPFSIGKLESRFRFTHAAVINNLSDLYFRRHLEDDAEALFGWSGMSSFTIKRANELGLRTFVYRSSPHIVEHYHQLRKERERFDIKNHSGIGDTLNIWKECYEYNEADKIVTQSDYTLNTFREHGIAEEKLVKIPFDAGVGVLNQFYEANLSASDSSTFRVCTATSVDLNRGVVYLLEAWREFARDKDDVKLFIAGKRENDFPDEVYSSFDERDDVRFLGYVTDVKELYEKSDVFALVSLADGGPNGPIEAMAAGLPVIVSENMGVREIVDEEVGIVAPVRDSKTIVSFLNHLYDNPDERAQMGRDAREKARSIDGRQRAGMKEFYRNYIE